MSFAGRAALAAALPLANEPLVSQLARLFTATPVLVERLIL